MSTKQSNRNDGNGIDFIKNNEFFIKKPIGIINNNTIFFKKIDEIIINGKFKNKIEEFKKFREATLTVSEDNLEQFIMEYISLIEAFWRIFFREKLEKEYQTSKLVVVSEKDLLPKYIDIIWNMMHIYIVWNPESSTIIIIKERFMKDFIETGLLKWDTWIILALAHEVWHVIQNQTYSISSQLNRKIKDKELEADFLAWIIARIFKESWIFNEDDFFHGEQSFYNSWLTWCIDTHWTAEERAESFRRWYTKWQDFVDLLKSNKKESNDLITNY